MDRRLFIWRSWHGLFCVRKKTAGMDAAVLRSRFDDLSVLCLEPDRDDRCRDRANCLALFFPGISTIAIIDDRHDWPLFRACPATLLSALLDMRSSPLAIDGRATTGFPEALPLRYRVLRSSPSLPLEFFAAMSIPMQGEYFSTQVHVWST